MSTYTTSLGLELITPGSQAGLWGNTTNNTFTLIDQAITGVTPISFASASGTTKTLTDYNGAADESRAAVLNITGTATGANTVVIPNKQKMYLVRNSTGQNVVFQTPSPSATYTVGAGYSILIFCDGNNNVFTGIAAPSVGTLLVNAGGTGATTFGTGGFVKSSGGTNALTASTTVALGSEVSGTLTVANGGTGQTSLTGGALLFGNGTAGVGTFIGSASGQVATWNGTAWVAQAPTTSGVTSVSAGTGISVSGSTGAVTIGNTGVTSLIAGTGIAISGSTGGITVSATGGGMVYPGAGIPLSGGTTWSTSFNNSTNPITASYGGTGVAGSLTGISYMNGVSAHTVATAAQIVSAIGSTAVTNATNATNATTAGTATNATNLTGSGSISSTTTATTQASSDNSTKIATTAFVNSLAFGVGQSWGNYASSRAVGTTYTNSTGRAIVVSVTLNDLSGGYAALYVNGVVVSYVDDSGGLVANAQLFAIVPPGNPYVVQVTGAPATIYFWSEMR